MKKKDLFEKLELNKRTLSNLEVNAIVGGEETDDGGTGDTAGPDDPGDTIIGSILPTCDPVNCGSDSMCCATRDTCACATLPCDPA